MEACNTGIENEQTAVQTWDMEAARKKLFLYCERLREEEKSKATIEKYKRDVKKFLLFLEGQCSSVEEMNKAIHGKW
ncbi:site-specific recombinase XerD [Aequitasia blattaphilus]|uniref:Core-binding (CB) domain-containing protein n=1 Tax=Aequitasia blattaphilus TaxID=2949332 RepID=A0ABT1E4Q0_9FIRM|nr:hypothetical protein [Aequitasia blattaphilus]MCP1100812.1 hypothetical protein [Aequitasia blattaphilus]MCR8613452.1 hypothetical protein [Aequitasia blattaphilus]